MSSKMLKKTCEKMLLLSGNLRFLYSAIFVFCFSVLGTKWVRKNRECFSGAVFCNVKMGTFSYPFYSYNEDEIYQPLRHHLLIFLLSDAFCTLWPQSTVIIVGITRTEFGRNIQHLYHKKQPACCFANRLIVFIIHLKRENLHPIKASICGLRNSNANRSISFIKNIGFVAAGSPP